MKEEIHAQKDINAQGYSLPEARKRKSLVYKRVLLQACKSTRYKGDRMLTS